jgi:hypothetical protein
MAPIGLFLPEKGPCFTTLFGAVFLYITIARSILELLWHPIYLWKELLIVILSVYRT